MGDEKQRHTFRAGPLKYEGEEPPSEVLRRLVLEYGPVIVGGGIWAYSKFPERLRFTGDIFKRVFGLLAAFYDDWTNVAGYGDALEEGLKEVPGLPQEILDLATGTGYVARRLKKLYAGAEVLGVDISPEMVAIARHQAVAEGVDIKFEIADIAALPYPDKEFDLVTLQNAMPFPEEIMRVTKPGGSVLLVFSFGGPWAALAWPQLKGRLSELGAGETIARRSGTGFFAVVKKGNGKAP